MRSFSESKRRAYPQRCTVLTLSPPEGRTTFQTLNTTLALSESGSHPPAKPQETLLGKKNAHLGYSSRRLCALASKQPNIADRHPIFWFTTAPPEAQLHSRHPSLATRFAETFFHDAHTMFGMGILLEAHLHSQPIETRRTPTLLIQLLLRVSLA
jgi:hypothetical protein